MAVFIVFIAALVFAVVTYFGYRAYQDNQAAAKAAASQVGAGVSAFGKLAEAEGKLIALKAATEAKALEAKAVHSTLDEIHKLLG